MLIEQGGKSVEISDTSLPARLPQARTRNEQVGQAGAQCSIFSKLNLLGK